MTPVEARFLQKVDQSGECWEWKAQRIWSGYGSFFLNGKHVGAHRAAYRLFVGPIPDGLTIDHLCRNRACVRPSHLEVVSGRENTLRGDAVTAINARKAWCSHGHPFDAANTYFGPGGRRSCRACGRFRTAKWEAGRRASAPDFV